MLKASFFSPSQYLSYASNNYDMMAWSHGSNKRRSKTLSQLCLCNCFGTGFGKKKIEGKKGLIDKGTLWLDIWVTKISAKNRQVMVRLICSVNILYNIFETKSAWTFWIQFGLDFEPWWQLGANSEGVELWENRNTEMVAL